MKSAYSEVFIDSAGTKICLSVWDAGKEKPVVVFLPGSMAYPLFYEKFLGKLAGSGFNVVGVHFISHGKSPREKSVYSFGDMKQNAKDAITYAVGNFNDEVFLLGTSQGGILALAVAAEDSRVRAVFPHNILQPVLPQSLAISNFPAGMGKYYKESVAMFAAAAEKMPDLKLPLALYLDVTKLSKSKETIFRFLSDPLCLKSYPAYFLASLISADMSKTENGSIKCPVFVLTAKNDPLFPLSYTKIVFKRVKAPYKKLTVFDSSSHDIFNDIIGKVLPAVVWQMNKITAKDRMIKLLTRKEKKNVL